MKAAPVAVSQQSLPYRRPVERVLQAMAASCPNSAVGASPLRFLCRGAAAAPSLAHRAVASLAAAAARGGVGGVKTGVGGGEKTGGCEKRKGETTSHAGCAYTIVHPKTNRYTTEQHTSRAGTRPTPYSYHTPPSKNGDTDQESYSSRRCGLRLDGDERKTAWQAGGLAQKRSVGVDGAPSGIIGHLLEHRDAAQAAHLFLVPAEQGGELSCRRGAR